MHDGHFKIVAMRTSTRGALIYLLVPGIAVPVLQSLWWWYRASANGFPWMLFWFALFAQFGRWLADIEYIEHGFSYMIPRRYKLLYMAVIPPFVHAFYAPHFAARWFATFVIAVTLLDTPMYAGWLFNTKNLLRFEQDCYLRLWVNFEEERQRSADLRAKLEDVECERDRARQQCELAARPGPMGEPPLPRGRAPGYGVTTRSRSPAVPISSRRK